LLPGAAGNVGARLHQRSRPREGRLGDHAGRPLSIGDHDHSGVRRGLDRLFRDSRSGGEMMRPLLLIGAFAMALSACDSEPDPAQYGASPELPEPQRGLLPSMKIPRPANWGDELPTVPAGYTIEAIATDLMIPRQSIVLPNGDILVAEGSGGNAPPLRPKDFIAGFIKSLGKSSVPGGDRLTLLRDADGDGSYEARGIFADNLNAPYGLALIDDAIYVANQDALARFDYSEGQTEASGPPTEVTELPSAINHHWTKAMTASADGRFLYVGIGSNSNITER